MTGEKIFTGNCKSAMEYLSGHRDEFEGDIRQQLASFTGVSSQTVKRWLNGSQLPIGEPFIRLINFLSHSGFELEEVQCLQPDVSRMGQLISFQVMDLDSICSYLGYNSRDALMRVLFGKAGMSEEKIEKLGQLISDYVDLLDQSCVEVAPLRKKNVSSDEAQEPATIVEQEEEIPFQKLQKPEEPAIVDLTTTRENIITGGSSSGFARLTQQRLADQSLIRQSFVAMLHGIHPLAEAILSSKFSPEVKEMILQEETTEITELIQLLQRILSSS